MGFMHNPILKFENRATIKSLMLMAHGVNFQATMSTYQGNFGVLWQSPILCPFHIYQLPT